MDSEDRSTQKDTSSSAGASSLSETWQPPRERNIFAYTAPGADFPEFISVNRRDGELYISVRGPGGTDSAAAEARLPADQLDNLIYYLRGCRPMRLLGSGASGDDPLPAI